MCFLYLLKKLYKKNKLINKQQQQQQTKGNFKKITKELLVNKWICIKYDNFII